MSAIPGLQYIPDYLTNDAHDQLLYEIDSQPWQPLEWSPFDSHRRVQCYGYAYDFAKGTADLLGDLPPWATEVAARLERDGLMPYLADQVIINEYAPGHGIISHVDAPVFADAIASISLGSACVMELTHARSGQVHRVLLEPRSVVVLAGEARSEWKHGIPAQHTDRWMEREIRRGRRVSLTYRRMQATASRPRAAT